MKWTVAQLRDAVKNSENYSDVLRYLKLRTAGGNWRTVKKYVNLHNIDTSHFSNRKELEALKNANPPHPDEVIFCDNSIVYRSTLRVAYAKKSKYKCATCGNTGHHRGKPLKLQIDHINGKHNDNRIENLRWLCPNCHSQTDTFAGRNTKLIFCKTCGVPCSKKSGYCRNECRPKKIKSIGKSRKVTNWPSVEIVKNRVKEVGYQKYGKELNVSGNGVKKFLKRNGVVLPEYYTQHNLY